MTMKNAIFLLLCLLPMIPMAAASQTEKMPELSADSSKLPTKARKSVPAKKVSTNKPGEVVPVKAKNKKNFTSGLVGVWYNSNYPFEGGQRVEGTYVKYEFRNDGSFTRIIGHDKFETVENGKWSFADDRKSISLRTPDRSYQVKVKYLELDAMVLEQEVKVDDTKLCTPRKDFYFNKI